MADFDKKNKLEGEHVIAQQKYMNAIFNDFIDKDIKRSLEERVLFGLNNIDVDVNLSQKLERDNRSSFLKSKLKKFLHFAKIMDLPIVRMVSHSHTMRNFAKFCYENNKKIIEKLENTVDKQNAWSMFLETNDTTFIVSRHGYSVANFLKHSKGTVAMIKEQDPSLALWGILTSIYRSDELHQEELNYLKDKPELHNPKYIHVSILLRTWMTAVCLYLSHVNGNSFTLVVSPYLKEDGITNDNQPLKVESQLVIFAAFFDYLGFLNDSISSREESRDSETFLGKIKLQLHKIVGFVSNSNNQIVIKHLSSNYKLKYSSKGYVFVLVEEKPLNMKIYNGVCKPNSISLKKLKVDCEFFASAYKNTCVIDGKKMPTETSLFNNNCNDTHKGGARMKETRTIKKTRKTKKPRKIKKTGKTRK
jgi:hypothetical protein